MRKFFVLLFLSILVLGCTQYQPSGNQTNSTAKAGPTVKIGAVLPLSGTLANVGAGMKDALLMAVDDINAQGGIGGKKVELVLEDTSCDPAKAVPALNKMITQDKIIGLVGGTCSGESLAIAPILSQNKLVAVSPSATSPDLTTKGGNYFFRVVPSDSFQAKVAAKYAKEKAQRIKAAILYINNDWGVGLKDVFSSEFKADGGLVSGEEAFESGATDMRTQIAKLEADSPDLIYLPCYPAECAVALQQLSDSGFKGTVLGADGADDAATLSKVPAADGLLITVPSGAGENFTSRFQAKYGHAPGVYTAQAYDALMLLSNSGQNSTSGPDMDAYLHNVFGYFGQSGIISFDKNGDINSARYDVKQFKGGNFTVVQKISAN